MVAFWWDLHEICKLLFIGLSFFTMLIILIHGHCRSFNLLIFFNLFFRRPEGFHFVVVVVKKTFFYFLCGILLGKVIYIIHFIIPLSFWLLGLAPCASYAGSRLLNYNAGPWLAHLTFQPHPVPLSFQSGHASGSLCSLGEIWSFIIQIFQLLS
jgi:hypothetical protein